MPRTGSSTGPGPDIGRHLLRDEGEVIVDEVGHHWIVFVVPALIVLSGVAVLVGFPYAPLDLAWFPYLLGLGLVAWGAYRWWAWRADWFVITNMRVFRIHGVLNRHLATMPLRRILDITVTRTLPGRLLGYGHFVFESAAQDQGLRDIRFIGRVYERDLAIQRVVQRSGLRGRAVN